MFWRRSNIGRWTGNCFRDRCESQPIPSVAVRNLSDKQIRDLPLLLITLLPFFALPSGATVTLGPNETIDWLTFSEEDNGLHDSTGVRIVGVGLDLHDASVLPGAIAPFNMEEQYWKITVPTEGAGSGVGYVATFRIHVFPGVEGTDFSVALTGDERLADALLSIGGLDVGSTFDIPVTISHVGIDQSIVSFLGAGGWDSGFQPLDQPFIWDGAFSLFLSSVFCGAKFADFLLNTPTPCPRRDAVPVNSRMPLISPTRLQTAATGPDSAPHEIFAVADCGFGRRKSC